MLVFGKVIAGAVTVLLCFFLLQSYFPPVKSDWGKRMGLFIGCWIFLCSVGLLGQSVFLLAGATAVTAGVLCRWLSRETVGRSLLFALSAGALRLAAFGAGWLLSRVFPDLPETALLLAELTVLYALGVCVSVFSERWRMAPAPVLGLLPVFLVSVVLCGEVIRNRQGGSMAVLVFFADLWLVYGAVQLIPVSRRMEERLRDIQKQREKARHYALQEEYYEQLREKQTQTRALWHDLNKYLRAAKAETPSAKALEQLEAMMDSASQIVDVGNRVVNVILNEYAQAAKAHRIELRMKVQLPSELPVSGADLYILMGNTLDNALEACKALPPDQRLVELILRTHHHVLYYKLTNPYESKAVGKKPDPLRGYGLENVRRCVDAYSGSMDVKRENGFFIFTAHLNMDME